MTALLFLLLAGAIVAVGCTVIWWKNRQPSSLEFGISEFQRELAALSPDRDKYRRRPPRPWEQSSGDVNLDADAAMTPED